ncbi:MAG: hypothetical protein IPP40_11120 [bacterium]|nr:hypothetical protein [bacterium]
MKKTVLLLAVLALISGNSAIAKTNIGLKGIGPRAGFVDPDHRDGAITLGAVADMGTWTREPSVGNGSDMVESG